VFNVICYFTIVIDGTEMDLNKINSVDVLIPQPHISILFYINFLF